MAAKATIKQKRLRQLYAQGINTSKLGEWFKITHQAVSKVLDRKTNAGLQKQHVARRNQDKKLVARKDIPRARKRRVKALYGLGFSAEFVVRLLGLPEQVVTEMIAGDAELERLHTARVALDRKLIAGEPVTEADFAADQAAPLPDSTRRRDASGDDRGEPTPSRAQAAVAEDAENATTERSETQPESATQKAKPTSSWQRDLQRFLQKWDAEAAAAVQLVVKHVGAAYGYHPGQFTGKETTPEFKEARQVAMSIALRGFPAAQLAQIFDCPSITIYRANSEIASAFPVDETLRGKILSAKARIREEKRASETVVSHAQPG